MESSEEHAAQSPGGLAAKWTALTTIASFCVYMLGYLAIRFQLTALGLGTDLELLDERYLFEGAKFLVYFVSTIPVVVLYGLPLVALGWLVLRYAPACQALLTRWWSRPVIPLTAGIIASVLMIQFVMRTCFRFDNLLLRETLPEPGWFQSILTDASDAPAQIYFTLLLAAIVVLAGLVFALGSWQTAPLLHRGLALLLVLLIGIQFLLLPVNYGIVLGARSRPRLAPSPEGAPIEPGETAWLIWEGKTGVTFLVRDGNSSRKLLTVPRDTVKRVDIVAYDPLAVIRELPSSLPNGRPKLPLSSPDSRPTWERIVRTLLIPPSPLNQRDPLPSDAKGKIFIVPSLGGEEHEVTSQGGFSSPIFMPGDDSLLALRGDRLLQIDLAGGAPKEIAPLPGVAKLLGFDPNRPNEVLFLVDVNSRHRIGWFDVMSKQLGTLSYFPTDKQGQWSLKYLQDDDREVTDVRLLVKFKDPNSLWTDIFIQRDGKVELNLTRGSGANNRQPALSHNGRHVAFVRVSDSR
jgi:hypothetical protein